VTLCIAAECQYGRTPCIAMSCDTRAERGGVFQELVGSEDVEKVRDIGPVTALLSGSETDADELLTLCENAIRAFAVNVPVDESDLAITNFLSGLREAAAERKKILVDHHLRMTVSMTFDEFVKRHRNELTESFGRDVWAQIQQIDLGADIVLCGFSRDEPLIVRLDRYGKTHWETNYSVVGIGSDIALAFLCQRDWETKNQETLELPDCLYRIFEAKRASEKNRHVGKSTVFQVLMPGEKRADITDQCYKVFKETYRTRLRLKPFEFEASVLKDWDDEKKTVPSRDGKFVGRSRTHDSAMPLKLKNERA
jgi:20S proteasome alpha/beta subunit